MRNALRNTLVAIVVALLPALLTATEPSGAPKPDKPAGSAKVPPLRNAHSSNPCAAYGAGFARVEGTDTCVKIGGAVSIGVGVR